jgi:hypothetical protein
MSAGVEIIGIDSILSLIQSYDFTAIKLTHGEKSPENKFNMTVSEDYGQDDIVAEFDKRFRNYPTTNFSKYALNITYLLKNNKSTNLTYQVSFYTNQSNSAISKSTTDKGSGKESNELSFNNLKQRIGICNNKLRHIRKRMVKRVLLVFLGKRDLWMPYCPILHQLLVAL